MLFLWKRKRLWKNDEEICKYFVKSANLHLQLAKIHDIVWKTIIKERDMYMLTSWIKGDLDDMIFAGCDTRPSER